MRYDELASEAEIERSKRFGQNVKKGAMAIAGTALAGASLPVGASRIAPLLSDFIKPEIALKGLEKIAPKLGKSLRKGMESGLSLKEGINFLRESLGQSEEKQQQKENPTISQARELETQYPQLIQALMRIIQNGQPPQGAAAILKNQSQFRKDISKIEKESGKNFVDLIIELMGNRQQEQNLSPQMEQVAPNEMQQPMSPTGNVQQGQGVDPKLMALLQNLQQGIQNLRGPRNG